MSVSCTNAEINPTVAYQLQPMIGTQSHRQVATYHWAIFSNLVWNWLCCRGQDTTEWS